VSDKISIETAYNVEFEYTLSNVWDRVWAYLIDSLIKIGYMVFVFAILASTLEDNVYLYIILLIPYLIYSLAFESFNNGQTPLASISTRRRQRIGDMSANTTVITLKEKTSVKKSSKVRLPDGFVGTFPQTTKLKDEEVELIKDVVRNNTPAGNKLRLAMAEKMVDYLGIPKETKSKEYLKQIVFEYNYFISLEEGLIEPPSSNILDASSEEE